MYNTPYYFWQRNWTSLELIICHDLTASYHAYVNEIYKEYLCQLPTLLN